jgi:glycine betaine/proline transport system ATP-binding protein
VAALQNALTGDPAVECRHVWKLFGPNALRALPTIEAERLSKAEVVKRFDCVVGVADVSLTVARGEIFCIMGLSGSGKSTLVRHINRLIEPTAGQILIYGEDIGLKSPKELRQLRATKIGMVFQNMALFPHRTVRDNVAFGLEVRGIEKARRREVAEETLRLVQLAGWEDRSPDQLSGGMQQRVGLARALAADPDILLMDEPFSALDPLIRRELQDQFIELSKLVRKTTLFITHDLEEAIRLGHRIAIMKDGRLVQIGTPEDIVTAPADEYVANFVAGISRLKLVTARKIMRDVSAAEANSDFAGWSRVLDSVKLDVLVDLAVGSDSPTLVVSAEGAPIGVVDKSTLLKGIQGSQRHG